MKLGFFKLFSIGLFFACPPAHGQYSVNVVGYVNRAFQPGDNFFANPLLASTNTLSGLFSQYLPEGTTISLWDPATTSFATSSTFHDGSWSLDLTLSPGTGARLTTSLLFTNTFVGNALNHDGTLYGGAETIPPPPVFSGSSGIYLFGDKTAIVDTGNDVFLNILGRLPNPGEKVIIFDELSQTYFTSTYQFGHWDIIPTLNPGDAAFFNLGPVAFSVPEPSSLSIGLLGLAAIHFYRCRKN